MVKIRLKRLGRKKRPFYRIVVTDQRNRRDGAPLVELGYYNPLLRELKLDKTLAQEWLAKGAIPSEVAKRLIEKAPESGELVRLEQVRTERLSKKAQEKAKAVAAAAAEAAATPPPAAEAPTEEAPAAADAPAAEAEAAPAE